MDKHPLVSIVTPSLNQGQSLEKTINSILEQDYPHIEYMIIDGGSTDDSLDIIHTYEDRLKCWVHEKDNGQAEAINKGWKRATGDIWAYLNSDDQLMPDAVSKIVNSFRNHPNAGAVYGDSVVRDQFGRLLGEEKGHQVTFRDLMKYGQFGIIQPACFFKAEVIQKVGLLDDTLFMAMDYDLLLRIAQVSNLVYIPETIVSITYTPETKTFSHPLQSYNECALIRKRYGSAWSGVLLWNYFRFRLFRYLPTWFQLAIRKIRNSIEDQVILSSFDK